MTKEEEKKWHEKKRWQEFIADLWELSIKKIPAFRNKKITWCGVIREDEKIRGKDIHKYRIDYSPDDYILATCKNACLIIENHTRYIEPETEIFVMEIFKKKGA